MNSHSTESVPRLLLLSGWVQEPQAFIFGLAERASMAELTSSTDNLSFSHNSNSKLCMLIESDYQTGLLTSANHSGRRRAFAAWASAFGAPSSPLVPLIKRSVIAWRSAEVREMQQSLGPLA